MFTSRTYGGVHRQRKGRKLQLPLKESRVDEAITPTVIGMKT